MPFSVQNVNMPVIQKDKVQVLKGNIPLDPIPKKRKHNILETLPSVNVPIAESTSMHVLRSNHPGTSPFRARNQNLHYVSPAFLSHQPQFYQTRFVRDSPYSAPQIRGARSLQSNERPYPMYVENPKMDPRLYF